MVARTSITLETVETVDYRNPFNVTATLVNDLGQPLTQEPIVWGTRRTNRTDRFTLVTDYQGVTRNLFNFSQITTSAMLYVNTSYIGGRFYLDSYTELYVPIDFPVPSHGEMGQTPIVTNYMLIIGVVLLVAAVGGSLFYWVKIRKRKKIVDMTDDAQLQQGSVQPEIISTDFIVLFPQITSPLPIVWEVDEPLAINIMANNDVPLNDVTLKYGVDKQEKLVFTDKIATATLLFSKKGTYPIQLFCGSEYTNPKYSINIKIVEYRAEIINLYKEWFKTYREILGGEEKYTARDFMYFLLKHHESIDPDRLDRAISMFEVADYSTHKVKRENYEIFYLNYYGVEANNLEE